MTDPTVMDVYIRCHPAGKGAGRYVKVIVTNGQNRALIGGDPNLWEIIEERVREVLGVPEGHICLIERAIWVPRKSPDKLFTEEIKVIDFSLEAPPPEIWLVEKFKSDEVPSGTETDFP